MQRSSWKGRRTAGEERFPVAARPGPGQANGETGDPAAAARDPVLHASPVRDVQGWRFVHCETDILSRLPRDGGGLSVPESLTSAN